MISERFSARYHTGGWKHIRINKGQAIIQADLVARLISPWKEQLTDAAQFSHTDGCSAFLCKFATQCFRMGFAESHMTAGNDIPRFIACVLKQYLLILYEKSRDTITENAILSSPQQIHSAHLPSIDRMFLQYSRFQYNLQEHQQKNMIVFSILEKQGILSVWKLYNLSICFPFVNKC